MNTAMKKIVTGLSAVALAVGISVVGVAGAAQAASFHTHPAVGNGPLECFRDVVATMDRFKREGATNVTYWKTCTMDPHGAYIGWVRYYK